jgi:hypothetical protein
MKNIARRIMTMSDLPIRALSIRQPWAWAIIYADKDVENRSWQAVNHGLKVRGRIAVHASGGMLRWEYVGAAAFMDEIGVQCPPAIDLKRGGIIGSVEIIDVVSDYQSHWFFGPRGLILRNPKPCDFIPAKGCLGYFDWRDRLTDAPVEPARWMSPKSTPHEKPMTLPFVEMNNG